MHPTKCLPLFCGFLVLLCPGWSKADPPLQAAETTQLLQQDVSFSQRMLHTWLEGISSPPPEIPSRFEATTVFTADAKFVTKGVLAILADRIPVQYEGTWQIKDGTLIETVTKSNSELAAVGTVTRDKIISVDDQALIYRKEDGHTITRKRKPDA